jgi:hypothetical protein
MVADIAPELDVVEPGEPLAPLEVDVEPLEPELMSPELEELAEPMSPELEVELVEPLHAMTAQVASAAPARDAKTNRERLIMQASESQSRRLETCEDHS